MLDFEGVEAITNGCADEMVATLIVQQDDRHILVANANSDVWDAITTAVARRGLDALPDREGKLVGGDPLPERSTNADRG